MVCLNAFHHRVLFFFDVSFTQRILMSASDVRIFVCIYIVIQRASFLVISLTFVSSFGSASMNFHNMKLMKVSSCHITAHALKFAHKSLKSVQFSIFLQYIAHTTAHLRNFPPLSRLAYRTIVLASPNFCSCDPDSRNPPPTSCPDALDDSLTTVCIFILHHTMLFDNTRIPAHPHNFSLATGCNHPLISQPSLSLLSRHVHSIRDQ
jgi:hypothetical protein